MLTWPIHPSQRGLIEAGAGARESGSNCAFAYRICGLADVALLRDAYQHVIDRLDALRLCLDDSSACSQWKAVDRPRVEISYHDLTRSGGGSPADAVALTAQCSHKVFNLRSGPIGTVTIWQVGPAEWVVSEVFDHTLVDGLSMSVLHAQVAAFYNEGHLLPLDSGYGALLSAADDPALRSSADEFWRRHFNGFRTPVIVNIPSPGQPTRASVTLPPSVVGEIADAAGRTRSTFAAVLFAAHAHAAARFSGTGDIAVLLAVDSRPWGMTSVFGQASMLLPVRVRHDWTQAVADHQASVSRLLLLAREHLAIDIDELDRCGAPVSINAPTATVFAFQDRPTQPPEFRGLAAEAIEQPYLHQAGGFVTAASVSPDGSLAIIVRVAEDASCYQGRSVQILDTIMSYLRGLQGSPAALLGADALLDRRSAALSAEISMPSAPYEFAPVGHLITERLQGDLSPVLIEAGRSWTSRELLDQVLRRETDLKREGVVQGQAVVCREETQFGRIATFIAAMRVGAVYVPADASCTLAQRAEIEDRCQSLRRWHPQPAGPGGSGLTRCTEIAPGDLPAYVIFTSGSTGRPKGVVVSHAALSNLAQGEASRFGLGADSRVLLIAPPTTDPWICHVTGSLLSGATLVAASPVSDSSLSDQIAANEVTHAFLPAVLMGQVDAEPSPSLKMVATAGDRCRPEDVERLLPLRVFNIYGPTEATVTSTIADLRTARVPVPIGRPIRGTGARVAIDGLATAPTCVAGELLVSGAGLARGYLDDESATRAKFRDDSLRPGERFYATGDLAWLGDDGQLYLHGRVDRQVKIRGFRVEPGQVEAAARASRLCSDAYAVPVASASTGASQLLLFAEQCARPDQLLRYLRRALPHFMVPSTAVPIDRLPRMPSGKVDVSRLPDPVPAAHEAEQGASAAVEDAAARPAARRLAQAWQRVLGVAPGPCDHFFSQGGDSLSVLRLAREAREGGLPLTPTQVYRTPQFQDLAESVQAWEDAPTFREAEPGLVPLSPSQHWFFSLDLPAPGRWTQSHQIRFTQAPSASALRSALAALLRRTPILHATIRADGVDYPISSSRAHPELIVLPRRPQRDIAALVGQMRDRLSPGDGRNIVAAAWSERDGSGTLMLVAHHLVVDDWSWMVIEDRLRGALSGPADGPGAVRDDAFTAYARALEAQYQAGAFDLESGAWDEILQAGLTAGARSHPTRVQQLVTVIPGDLHVHSARLGVPPTAMLLACLGHALHAIQPGEATIVDLERNGRGAVAGMDTADGVGWFALHHPVRVPHVPVSVPAIADLADSVRSAPAGGAGYGALRWRRQAVTFVRTGRYSVNISAHAGTTQQDALAGHVTASDPSPSNAPPYDAAFVFRIGPDSLRVECSFNPDRVAVPGVTELAENLAAAISSVTEDGRVLPTARTSPPRRDPFAQPIPASAMQQLMLEAAQAGEGVYRPRQLLVIEGVEKHERFLRLLSEFLGGLDPFRRRFSAAAGGFTQQVLPSVPVPIEQRPGELDGALAWLQAPDEIDGKAAADGGSLACLRSFSCSDGRVIVAMQIHHAVLDGASNQRLISMIRGAVNAQGREVAFPRADTTIDGHAVRKHVAAELRVARSIRNKPGAGLGGTGSVPLRTPVTEQTALSGSQLTRVMSQAERLSVDARAVFAAAALDVSRRESPSRPVYLVCNGRDPDIPETQQAMGLFWYFVPAVPQPGPLSALADQVFALAGETTRQLRALAAASGTWQANSAVSFNFTKAGAADGLDGRLTVIGHRELFHFRTQIHVALLADHTARVTLVSYAEHGKGKTPCGLAEYLDALGWITRNA